jgi:LysM repeat protein
LRVEAGQTLEVLAIRSSLPARIGPLARAGTAVLAVTTIVAIGMADTTRHTVDEGETLAGIARRYGTTITALAEANGLDDPNLIVAGTTLVVPGAGAVVTAPSSATTHTVRAGETLADIAERYGTTISALVDANAIRNQNLIVTGDRLSIPGRAPTGAGGSGRTAAASASAVVAATTHTVRAGENLADIAARYGTTVSALVRTNGIENQNLIVIGQRLAIPGGTPTSGYHVVRPGETLTAIASSYGLSPAALAAANGLVAPYRLYATTRMLFTSNGPAPALARCPVPGASFFNDWGFPRSGGRYHEGNDLFAARGTPVLAPASGSVVQVVGTVGGRQFRLYGDDGVTYSGSHLHAFGEKGRVSAGEVVGYVGDSGNALGARTHLHFEVHPGDGPGVNPYPALVAACR